MELADMIDSKSIALDRRVGSTPTGAISLSEW